MKVARCSAEAPQWISSSKGRLAAQKLLAFLFPTSRKNWWVKEQREGQRTGESNFVELLAGCCQHLPKPRLALTLVAYFFRWRCDTSKQLGNVWLLRKTAYSMYLHQCIAPDTAVQLQASHFGNTRPKGAVLAWYTGRQRHQLEPTETHSIHTNLSLKKTFSIRYI